MKNIFKTILAFFILIIFSNCGTVPDENKVPYDMTAIDLTQKAQEAFDINNYRGAKAWYKIILKRFGTDISVRTAAEYEIAHILIKQRKWSEADALLAEIIARYEGLGGMKLPPEFYKLAKIDYTKTQKKVKQKQKNVPVKSEKEDTPVTVESIE